MAWCTESQCMPQTSLTEALTTWLELDRREPARENSVTGRLSTPPKRACKCNWTEILHIFGAPTQLVEE